MRITKRYIIEEKEVASKFHWMINSPTKNNRGFNQLSSGQYAQCSLYINSQNDFIFYEGFSRKCMRFLEKKDNKAYIIDAIVLDDTDGYEDITWQFSGNKKACNRLHKSVDTMHKNYKHAVWFIRTSFKRHGLEVNAYEIDKCVILEITGSKNATSKIEQLVFEIKQILEIEDMKETQEVGYYSYLKMKEYYKLFNNTKMINRR